MQSSRQILLLVGGDKIAIVIVSRCRHQSIFKTAWGRDFFDVDTLAGIRIPVHT